MRTTSIIVFFLAVLIPFTVCADKDSITGENLFRSTDLGTNGRSCSSCHPDGKGLDKIADFDDVMLRDIINACIRDAMKGELLAEGAKELRLLAEFVRRYQAVE